MEIKQLSTLLDKKLAELDARVTSQEKYLSLIENPEEKKNIQLELEELARLRNKLIKSKKLALEAHDLEKNTNQTANKRRAIIGLSLCVFGGLLTTGLILLMFLQD